MTYKELLAGVPGDSMLARDSFRRVCRGFLPVLPGCFRGGGGMMCCDIMGP